MDSLENYPARYEEWLAMRNGREVFIRPIKTTDQNLVLDLFKKLSEQSINRRFLRSLHELPEDMLYQFTHINYHNNFALVTIVYEDNREAIIAVARYAQTANDILPELAIAVRDDWQHFGLGKPLLKKIVDIGKENGIFRFGGLMDPYNKIIRQVLVDLGYRVNYSLQDGFFQVEILVS